MQLNKKNNGWCFRADYLTRRLGIFLRVEEQDASAAISPETVLSLLQEEGMEDFSLEAIELAVASSQATLSNMSEVCNLFKVFNNTLTDFAMKIVPERAGITSPNYLDLPGQCSIDFDWRECALNDSNECLVNILEAIPSVKVVKQLKLNLSKAQTNPRTIELLLNIVNLKLDQLDCLNLTFQRYVDSAAFMSLQSTKVNYSLETLYLDLQSVSLHVQGSQYLSTFLGCCKNLKDLKLNLRYNRLEDQSVACIMNSLSSQQLTSVDLSIGCNPFKESGAESITEFLSSKTTSLKYLHLDMRMFETSQNFFSKFPHFNYLQNLDLNLAMTEFIQPEDSLLSLTEVVLSLPELSVLALNLNMSNLKDCNIETLFEAIEKINQLKQLKLNLTGTPFQEQRIKALENCLFAHEQSLQILQLDLNIRQTFKGNQDIYLDIFKLIEKNFPQLLHLEIPEIAKMKGFFFKNVLLQHSRVLSKLSLKRKLINSLLAIKNSIVFMKFRKEIAEELSSFLAESNYTEKPLPFKPTGTSVSCRS